MARPGRRPGPDLPRPASARRRPARASVCRIAWAWLTDRRKTFPIPLSDPALFTANPEGQAFIASDRLGLHAGTAGLLAASVFIDRGVRRALPKVRQPVLLMLAEHDRIVDNARTLESFEKLASADRQLIEYPGAHHTLEFEPDPTRYARDLIGWLDRVAASVLARTIDPITGPSRGRYDILGLREISESHPKERSR